MNVLMNEWRVMMTATVSAPALASALPLVADVIRANVPTLMAESEPFAAAYNDTLAAEYAAAAEAFAAEYAIECCADEPCSRVLASVKHAAYHATRVPRRNGNVLHLHESDGHTPMAPDMQARALSRVWADRVARAESTAMALYTSVTKYAGK